MNYLTEAELKRILTATTPCNKVFVVEVVVYVIRSRQKHTFEWKCDFSTEQYIRI